MKNRVVPARSPKLNEAKDLKSDQFFASTTPEKPGRSGQSYGRDPFFSKQKRKNDNFQDKFYHRNKEFKISQKSKNIKRNNACFMAERVNLNPEPIEKEKFKSLEEDHEHKTQVKNKCQELVKYEGRKEEKKPFDKKKWRLQKYSKKYKLQQWEEKRKKSVLKEYYQQLKDEKPNTDIKRIYEEYDSDEERAETSKINYVRHPDLMPKLEEKVKKKSTKMKVKMELERIKQEKEAKREEMLQKKQEKEEALKKYKEKKKEKQKKLNKKTKRGQPVMQGRIEMLLEKIQNS